MSSLDKMVREEVSRHYNDSVTKKQGMLNETPSDADLRAKFKISDAELNKLKSKMGEDLSLVDGKIKASLKQRIMSNSSPSASSETRSSASPKGTSRARWASSGTAQK